MKSMTAVLHNIRTALVEVTPKCYHYHRPEGITDSYIVWQEDSEESSFEANNHKEEQQIHGTVDYFTLTEFDQNIDAIQETLNSIMVGWRLNAVDYEDETNLIHYEWEFWVS